MCRINKTIKKCAAALLACCMVLNGVNLVAEEIMDRSSFMTDAIEAGAVVEFDDAMERKSTTVIIKHWHLVEMTPQAGEDSDEVDQESSIVAREVREEYRFYNPGNGAPVELYKKAGETNPYDDDYADDLFAFVGYQEDLTIKQNAGDSTVLDNIRNSDKADDQGYTYEAVDEVFSNFSLSSGQHSVDNKDSKITGEIKVRYEADSVNHLIKGHVFYVRGISVPVGVDFSESERKWLDLDMDKQNEGNEDDNVLNPYWDEVFERVIYTGEIDTCTDKDGLIYYNTSAGLHTDKTASVTPGSTDGRTFDVDLKAWYSGEDIADVGFVLDASGSMAWTTNVIKPLEVDPKFIKEYNIQPGQVLTAAQVDEILNPQNTDNALLSYTEYNYYVYDEKDGAEEFVPIAYWNGDMTKQGQKANNYEYDLIGYYPFEGNLTNAVTGLSAKMVKHAEDTDGVFDEDSGVAVPSPAFGNMPEIDTANTAKNGALLLDTNSESISTSGFTVSMRMRNDYFSGTYGSGETPILYIGNEDGTQYFEITKPSGNAINIHTSGVSNAGILNEEMNEIIPEEEFNEEIPEEEFNEEISEEEFNEEIPEEVFNEETPDEEVSIALPEEELRVAALEEDVNDTISNVWTSGQWVNLHFVFKDGNLTIYSNDGKNRGFKEEKVYQTNLVIDDAKVILGGNINGYDSSAFQNIAITALSAFNKALSNVEMNKIDNNGGRQYINGDGTGVPIDFSKLTGYEYLEDYLVAHPSLPP